MENSPGPCEIGELKFTSCHRKYVMCMDALCIVHIRPSSEIIILFLHTSNKRLVIFACDCNLISLEFFMYISPSTWTDVFLL